MKEISLETKVKIWAHIDEAPEDAKKLMSSAVEALKSSYSPYSNFRVGAALLLDNGEIIQGSNQENASYPAGLCAERVAFFTAGAKYPGVPVQAVGIVTSFEKEEPLSPCGSCRQVMAEYEHLFKNSIQVYLRDMNGRIYGLESVRSLLPLLFNADFLKKI